MSSRLILILLFVKDSLCSCCFSWLWWSGPQNNFQPKSFMLFKWLGSFSSTPSCPFGHLPKPHKVHPERRLSSIISAINHPVFTTDWKISPIISVSDIISTLPASSNWEARKVYKSASFYIQQMTNGLPPNSTVDALPSLSSLDSGKDPP